jgi:hypothetical protein
MKKAILQSLYLFLLTGICIFISSSCKKDDHKNSPDNADYYISFKADGVQKKYTNQAIASLGYSTQDKLYNSVLQGYQDFNTAGKSHIGIIIFDNTDITTGSYHDPQKAANADGNKISKVTISYYDDAGNGYLSMGPMVDENGNPLPGANGATADANVTINKLTSSAVEGTFSGTVFLSTDATFKTRIAITEGKFILKRLQ